MNFIEIFRTEKKKRKDIYFEKRGIIPYMWILCDNIILKSYIVVRNENICKL